MKKLSMVIGTIVLIEGLAGLVHEWLGWFRPWVIVRYLDFLDGYEIAANIVLVVAGLLFLFLGYEENETARS